MKRDVNFLDKSKAKICIVKIKREQKNKEIL